MVRKHLELHLFGSKFPECGVEGGGGGVHFPGSLQINFLSNANILDTLLYSWIRLLHMGKWRGWGRLGAAAASMQVLHYSAKLAFSKLGSIQDTSMVQPRPLCWCDHDVELEPDH